MGGADVHRARRRVERERDDVADVFDDAAVEERIAGSIVTPRRELVWAVGAPGP